MARLKATRVMVTDCEELFAEFARRLSEVYDVHYDGQSKSFSLRSRAKSSRGRLNFDPPVVLHLDRESFCSFLENLMRNGDVETLFPGEDPAIGAIQLALVHLDEILDTKLTMGSRDVVVRSGKLSLRH